MGLPQLEAAPSASDLGHQLRAVRATRGSDRNVTQALWARFGGRRSHDLGSKLVEQGVDRKHDHKVHGRGDDQKGNQRVEKVAILDHAAMNMQEQERKIRLAYDR